MYDVSQYARSSRPGAVVRVCLVTSPSIGAGPSEAVKDIAKHPLSKELQVYFGNIVDGVLGADGDVRERALSSAALDPGLHLLAPHFTALIADKAIICITPHAIP